MKIKFCVEVPLNKQESLELESTRQFPFLPRRKDMIAVADADDLREVDRIYWTPSDGFTVWFKFEEHAQHQAMKKIGWKETP